MNIAPIKFWCYFGISVERKFNGLINWESLKVAQDSEAKANSIGVSRLVDGMKDEVKPSSFEKSRPIVQAYNDWNQDFLKHAHTVQRISQQLTLSLCATDTQLLHFSPYLFQIFVQSKKSLLSVKHLFASKYTRRHKVNSSRNWENKLIEF